MTDHNQVFNTSSKLRWRAFQWVSRFVVFGFIMIIPVVWIALAKGYKPSLPTLKSDDPEKKKVANPVKPMSFSDKEIIKYKGFNDFLSAKNANKYLVELDKKKTVKRRIRAGFYVDWDPQSLYSLQAHIDQMNMVLPEWFFINPNTDTLAPVIDPEGLKVMKQHGVEIVPIINNINDKKGEGVFDGAMMHRIFHNDKKRKRLIDDIVKYLKLYGLQGINIDFEELEEDDDQTVINFQKELYDKLHPLGLTVTQDVMANNEDFNLKELAKYNDYLFLMAYDQHYSTSVPGPVSEQRWIEKVTDQAAAEVPSEKIILCIAGYGYDWPDGTEATTVSYQQAISNAEIYKAKIKFDGDTYNSSYEYTDENKKHHKVYLVDALGNYNTLRFADEYGTAGTAMWRLGSEDDRIWSFYQRNLDNNDLKVAPFDYKLLNVFTSRTQKPNYVGDGEILDVVTQPQVGKVTIEVDSVEQMITEQLYEQFPTTYVIRKFGNVKNEVILTFDDGPDEKYTSAILDILKVEKVPATFFIVGINAESNLDVLKRIYNEGHEIGNHTFTHPNIAHISLERAYTEMEATRLLIEAATGRSTILFRAPFNADAEPTRPEELLPVALSRQSNYYTIGESIDPQDWRADATADTIYDKTIMQYEENPEKGIILLHDAGGNRQATVDALPRIIKYFKKKGVKFTTVAALLHKTKQEVMPVVKGGMQGLGSGVALFIFWFENLLFAAFWVAISLGLIKIVLMATLAILQYIKRRKNIYTINKDSLVQNNKVSIIVPAYNEEVNASRTIHNLLLQDYPNFDIIFVDDGSSDKTYHIIKDEFETNPRVKVYTKTNGGKASALNFGIAQTTSEFVICIDADTHLKPNAISCMMPYFADENTGAVAGNVKVGNERNMLTRWQSIEYITAQNFDRRAFDILNCITVVPGAIGAFRKKAIDKAGGFTTDTLAEDCDLTIRILRNNYRIHNCPDAIAVTEAPETLKQFMKQRFRWCYGIMQSFWKNRDACFNPQFKTLGMVALPNILVYQIILPMLAPLADLMLVFSLFWNQSNPASVEHILFYYILFLGVDLLVSLIAFLFEKEKLYKLIWIIPQRLVYRQLMYIILFRSIKRAIKGETQQWGVLKRTGNIKTINE